MLMRRGVEMRDLPLYEMQTDRHVTRGGEAENPQKKSSNVEGKKEKKRY